MKLIVVTYCAILVLGLAIYGQSGNSDRCVVTAIGGTNRQIDADDIEKYSTVLGEFDTEIGEEVNTTRIFPLPKTRLFVIANVEYTDESLASEKGVESISLELSVSTKRKRDPLTSLAYALAEMPLGDFDVGRVITTTKSGQRKFGLIMECRKNVRLNSRVDSTRAYPPIWFAPINDPKKPDWEILPQEAKAGEVILSKRNELGILSNFAATPFELKATRYASVEGFWQMMLYPEGPDDERAKDKRVTWKFTREQVAQMTAFEAKSAGTLAEENMKTLGIDWVTFDGKRFPYRSPSISGGLRGPGEHYKLILAAMRAKANQNPEVKRILLATGDLTLKPDHHGEPNPPPEWKYYDLWMQIRSEMQTAMQKPAR